jgi:ubiquinone biosynthesis protein
MMSVVSAVRDLGRLREISAVLVRHGFGEIVARAGFGRAKKPDSAVPSERPPALPSDIPPADLEHGEQEKKTTSLAVRARLVLQDLGPTFIKLGQIASTRPDVLPADLIVELRKLQDEVPPAPFTEIRTQIEESLGSKISDLFVSFVEKPLATASIGQVHRAVLATPEGNVDVVVKVQRPGVGRTVVRDLELLHMMAAAVERTIPETKIYSPIQLVQQFDQSITSELNFMIEADNGERFTKNFEGNAKVRFPRIYRQASSKYVLTQEFFDGKKIDAALKDGADGPLLAKSAVGVVIKMIFEDGFFHADPHPGNILIIGTKETPVIGLIDLGMVGRLSPDLRDRTTDLMIAMARKDSYAVADTLYAIGKPTVKVDMRAYRQEVSMLAEKYIGKSLKEIELSAMIRDLVQGAVKFGIEIPPDFMMVGKSLMTLEGIGKQLDPNLDVFGEAQPYFLDLLKHRYSPERIGNELWRGFEQLSRAGYDMPMQVREVLDDLRLGRLSLRTVDPDMPMVVDRLGRRIFSGLVVVALIFAGAFLLRDPEHVTLGVVLFVFAAIVWMVHAFRDWRRKLKQPL